MHALRRRPAVRSSLGLAGACIGAAPYCGQAPGRKVHESGIPWKDPSGDRLRNWLGLSSEQFYDPRMVAIILMGFCYPGKAASGDMPPRRECALRWHGKLNAHLPDITLTLY